MKNMCDVLIQQRILTPYRLPFFQELSKNKDINYEFAYGQSNPYSALQSILQPQNINRTLLKNIYFSKKETVVVQRGIFQLLRRRKYHIVIAEANPRIVTNIFLLFYAKYLGIKFVWWGHGKSHRSGFASIKIRILLAKWADAFIFYDEKGKKSFAVRGVSPQKLFVAPNSIETEEILALRKKVSYENRYRILYIGRLIPAKKVDLLIRAFAKIQENLSRNYLLTIVGEGPEKTELQELIHNLNLKKRVELVGALYKQSELAPLFNSAILSISPGYIGLSIIHSFAYGLPMVIAREEPHRPEITVARENENCLYFQSGDIQDLADKIVTLANNKENWLKFSKQAADIIECNYGYKPMLEAFNQAINFVLKTEK